MFFAESGTLLTRLGDYGCRALPSLQTIHNTDIRLLGGERGHTLWVLHVNLKAQFRILALNQTKYRVIGPGPPLS